MTWIPIPPPNTQIHTIWASNLNILLNEWNNFFSKLKMELQLNYYYFAKIIFHNVTSNQLFCTFRTFSLKSWRISSISALLYTDVDGFSHSWLRQCRKVTEFCSKTPRNFIPKYLIVGWVCWKCHKEKSNLSFNFPKSSSIPV